MQEEQSQLTPEEAKATLGLSTRLSEQFLMTQLPQMAEEGSQEPQEAQQQESTSEPKEEPQQEETNDIEERMADMEKRLMDNMKRETDSIRKAIQDAVEEWDI